MKKCAQDVLQVEFSEDLECLLEHLEKSLENLEALLEDLEDLEYGREALVERLEGLAWCHLGMLLLSCGEGEQRGVLEAYHCK